MTILFKQMVLLFNLIVAFPNPVMLVFIQMIPLHNQIIILSSPMNSIIDPIIPLLNQIGYSENTFNVHSLDTVKGIIVIFIILLPQPAGVTNHLENRVHYDLPPRRKGNN